MFEWINYMGMIEKWLLMRNIASFT